MKKPDPRPPSPSTRTDLVVETPRYIFRSADEFFDDRRDWLEAMPVELEPGWFDIVLKIDGSYAGRGQAQEIADSFTRDLQHILSKLDPERDCTEDFGPWTLDRETLVLRIEGVRKPLADLEGYAYEIDLEQCRTSAEVLDWIMQVARKSWATGEVIAGLVRALNVVLEPQAHLCSFGKSTSVSRAKVRELVDRFHPSKHTPA